MQALRSVARAYASILFGGEERAGALLLAGTLVRPASGLGGLLAVLTAHGLAGALGYRRDAIRAGVYGYNALLLGLAATVGRSLDPGTVLAAVAAGALSVVLTATLADVLARGANLPVLALPFVLLGGLLSGRAAPGAAGWVGDEPLLSITLRAPEPALAVLRGLGAIFFHASAEAGLVVLVAATALSRIGAAALVAGGVVGLAVSPEPGVVANAALVMTAVSAHLLVPGRAACVAGLAAATAAAWLTTIFPQPVLCWPFVLVTLLTLRALALRGGDRAPFAPPVPGLTPEANLERARALEQRFGVPGPPRFVLPVAGAWTVTQGIDGEHTHKGPWEHAWDFERLDERGFPFRGEGARLEEWLSFGEVVLAPGAGEVAAVHDGAPDLPPGEVDTEKPWGNTVVLRHGAELFTVVAHLRRGSIKVKPGQVVAAGEPIAECGSSGRSPRPHVHLQAQRSPELGAPAIPCRIVRYVVEGETPRFVALGVPLEGERVSSRARSPLVDAFAALQPGLETELAGTIDGRRARLRLRSELDLLGERFLRDLDRGDRLFFSTASGDLAFLAHDGPADAPLRALFLALPRLPSVTGDRVAFDDRPPASALLGRLGRALHDLARVLADPIETRTEGELLVSGETLHVRSRTGLGLAGRVRWRTEATVEVGRFGLSRLELVREGGQVDLRAVTTPPPDHSESRISGSPQHAVLTPVT